MLQDRSLLHSFLSPNNMTYGYTTFWLSIQLMDIWVVRTFWLLGMRLLWTFVYKFSCGLMFSFLLGIYLVMELLGHVVTWYFWGTTKWYFKGAAPVFLPTSSVRGFPFLHIFTSTLLLSVFLILGILVGMKWNLLVLSVCPCLMANDIEHLLMCLLAICVISSA